MNLLRKIQGESEVRDQFGNGEATQVHHITILRAYDKSEDKRLLQAAQQLSDWLQDKEINDITPFSKDLCMLQIIKRQRELFSSLVLLDDEKMHQRFLENSVKNAKSILWFNPFTIYMKRRRNNCVELYKSLNME